VAAQTRVEAFIDQEVGPQLGPGEVIRQRAYLRTARRSASRESSLIGAQAKAVATMVVPTGGPVKKALAYFAALTDQRLFLFEARLGLLSPILENRFALVYEPGDIRVLTDAKTLTIQARDGVTLCFRRELESKHSATQRQFFELLSSRARAPS
jgi:hypothetical protein